MSGYERVRFRGKCLECLVDVSVALAEPGFFIGHLPEEVVVHPVELWCSGTWQGLGVPGTHHSVLAEDGVFGADEAELVHGLLFEGLRVELLEGQTHVEQLAVIVNVSVVAVHPAGTAEAVDDVLPDECGVVR